MKPPNDPLDLVIAAIDEIAPRLVDLGRRPAADYGPELRWITKIREVSGPLRDALNKTPPFSQWTNAMLNMGAGATGVQPLFLAEKLAALTADSGPDFARTAFRKLTTSSSAAATARLLGWGLTSGQELQLSPAVKFRPLSFDEAQRMLQQDPDIGWHHLVNVSAFVLEMPVQVTPLLLDGADIPDVWTPAFRELQLTLAALSLLSDGPVLSEAAWMQFDDSHLGALSSHGRTSWTHEVRPTRPWSSSQIDQDATAVVQAFVGLSEDLIDRFGKIIVRLSNAKRRRGAGDQALEACIALEMLLSGKGDQYAPATFRLALRAALMLGLNLDDRRAIRRSVTEAYRLRSSAAHGGALSGADEAIAQQAVRVANMLAIHQLTVVHPIDWATLEIAPPQLSSS